MGDPIISKVQMVFYFAAITIILPAFAAYLLKYHNTEKPDLKIKLFIAIPCLLTIPLIVFSYFRMDSHISLNYQEVIILLFATFPWVTVLLMTKHSPTMVIIRKHRGEFLRKSLKMFFIFISATWLISTSVGLIYARQVDLEWWQQEMGDY